MTKLQPTLLTETMPTLLLAGTSGSGKTTVAHRLASLVTGRALVLSLDNYERLGTECRVEPDGFINWEHPDSRDFDTLVENMQDLQASRTAVVPHELTFRPTPPGDCLYIAYRTVAPPDLLIVEGHLLLTDPRVRALGTLAVFLDTSDNDMRLLRRQHQSRDPYYETTYFEPGEATFVVPSRSHANVVYDTAQLSANAIAADLLAKLNMQYVRAGD